MVTIKFKGVRSKGAGPFVFLWRNGVNLKGSGPQAPLFFAEKWGEFERCLTPSQVKASDNNKKIV